MDDVGRREFLKMVGVVSGSVAVGAATPAIASAFRGPEVMTFRAVGGLPSSGLPAYASYVLLGSLNLTTRSGVLTRTVYAGSPEAPSEFALPGMTRVIRVTNVRVAGGVIEVTGVIDDRSQLSRAESPFVTFLVDRGAGTVRAPFVASDVLLHIQR
jgi:hypothetical protein